MIAQPKDQRVGVFVDVQNLYYSAKNIYNSKINFKELLKIAVDGRKLIRAMAYVIKADVLAEKTFFDALEQIGFEIKSKDLQVFFGGFKKGDWDVGIAMDAIEVAPKVDTVVIISGDGDFLPLVEHLQRAMGCRVEVIAFGKSGSSMLKKGADNFIDLDERTRYILLKDKRRKAE